MKTGALPKQLDLRGLAARGVEISGTVSLEDLPRLADSGMSIVGSGSAAFDFRRDEEARYIVAVSVEATVVMQCQRCLSDMEVPLSSASVMACVWNDDEAAALDFQGKQSAQRNEVADPYLIDLDDDGPVRWREAIRANGPTVRRDLGYQADGRS